MDNRGRHRDKEIVRCVMAMEERTQRGESVAGRNHVVKRGIVTKRSCVV